MELPSLGSWWTISTLLLGGVGLLYLYLTHTHDYWRKRGIPYVKPLPVFGNIKDVMLARKNLGMAYRDLYWKLDGYKYGGVFKFSQPVLLIRDPELIKTVLVKDFNSFHDNDLQADPEVDPLFGRNPFVLSGERWKITRAQLTPAFSSGKIKPYYPLIEEVCEELQRCIEKSVRNVPRAEFEVKELCAQFTTDVVATCAYGIRGTALQDPNCEFRRMGREMLEPSFWKNIKILIIFLLPSVAKLLRLGFCNQKVNKFFERIVTEVITYRQKHNVSRVDYLQHLINLKNKGSIDGDSASNGIEEKGFDSIQTGFTDADIYAQASTFFVDGFETSSAAMSFVLYCLAVNPEVQAKLRDEVDTVLNKYGGQLSFDAIQEMTYLDMVLSESLRMYPAGMVILRLCTKPFQLPTPSGGTYEVEVGTPVAIPVYAIHHDPLYYPDPTHYDPERFTEENKQTRHRYSYLGFGEGPRICLGFRFAIMQVKSGLVTVIKSFKVLPNNRTPVPIVPDPNFFMFAAKGGLWLDFEKRTDK